MITDSANYDLRIQSGLHYETPINMAFYDKSDLKYQYNWSVYEENDPNINGGPDSISLNLDDGHEMLQFINEFAQKHRFVNKMTGTIIERLIKDHLPGHLNSHEKVMEWLENSG